MGFIQRLTSLVRPPAVALAVQKRQTYASLEQTKRLNQYLRTQFKGDDFVRFPISSDSIVDFNNPSEQIAGGLLYFRQTSPDKKIILIGDKHANLFNFRAIIEKHRAGLENGIVQLVFLGDLIHPEHGSPLDDMTSSIIILKEMMDLMEKYPGRIHLLRGDHENLFDKNLHKNMIFQCDEMRKALMNEAGPEFAENYIQEVQAFFENLPYFAFIAGKEGLTFAGHSPIAKGGRTLAQLIAARNDRAGPNDRSSYLYNRPLSLTTGSKVEEQNLGYSDADVRMMLRRMFNIDNGFKQFGFARVLSDEELAGISIVTGHNRFNKESMFRVPGFTNPLLCLQSYLPNPKIIEITQGAISFTTMCLFDD